jgi:hypothetical protein
MKALESNISNLKIIEFYNKCVLPTETGETDVICIKTLNDVIMTYKLGGYGKEFFTQYLEA